MAGVFTRLHPFGSRLTSYWKWLFPALGTVVLPYLRQRLIDSGVDWGWDWLRGPVMLDGLWNAMASNPVGSVMVGVAFWLAIAAGLSERHVRMALRLEKPLTDGPTAPTVSDPRLGAAQYLLREAAGLFRITPLGKDGGVLLFRLHRLLEQGFTHRIKPDFLTFLESERRKGVKPNQETIAGYLDALAARLALDDVDLGFRFPATFHASSDDWAKNDRASQYQSPVLQQFAADAPAPTSLQLLKWGQGDPTNPLPEYRDWSHVNFMIDGTRKERGRAYIQVKRNGEEQPRRVACIAWSDGWASGLRDMLPGEPYHVEVFLRLKQRTELWLDKQRQHPIGYRPIYTDPGCYVTDEIFMNRTQPRHALTAGTYSVRVVLAIGDVAHRKEYESDWKEFVVS